MACGVHFCSIVACGEVRVLLPLLPVPLNLSVVLAARRRHQSCLCAVFIGGERHAWHSRAWRHPPGQPAASPDQRQGQDQDQDLGPEREAEPGRLAEDCAACPPRHNGPEAGRTAANGKAWRREEEGRRKALRLSGNMNRTHCSAPSIGPR